MALCVVADDLLQQRCSLIGGVPSTTTVFFMTAKSNTCTGTACYRICNKRGLFLAFLTFLRSFVLDKWRYLEGNIRIDHSNRYSARLSNWRRFSPFSFKTLFSKLILSGEPKTHMPGLALCIRRMPKRNTDSKGRHRRRDSRRGTYIHNIGSIVLAVLSWIFYLVFQVSYIVWITVR